MCFSLRCKSKQNRNKKVCFWGVFLRRKRGAYCIFEGKEKVGLSYDEGCLKVGIRNGELGMGNEGRDGVFGGEILVALDVLERFATLDFLEGNLM